MITSWGEKRLPHPAFSFRLWKIFLARHFVPGKDLQATLKKKRQKQTVFALGRRSRECRVGRLRRAGQPRSHPSLFRPMRFPALFALERQRETTMSKSEPLTVVCACGRSHVEPFNRSWNVYIEWIECPCGLRLTLRVERCVTGERCAVIIQTERAEREESPGWPN